MMWTTLHNQCKNSVFQIRTTKIVNVKCTFSAASTHSTLCDTYIHVRPYSYIGLQNSHGVTVVTGIHFGQDQGRTWVIKLPGIRSLRCPFPPLSSPPLSSPLLPSFSFPSRPFSSPSHFLFFAFPFHPLPFPSLLTAKRPPNPARGSGGALLALPVGSTFFPQHDEVATRWGA